MSNNSEKPTIKQQREAQRAAKVAAMKQKQAAEKRRRTIGITAAIVGAVAVVALIVAFVVVIPALEPDAAPDPVASGDPADIEIEGLETFENINATHVEGEVDYAMSPPAGGDHNATWLNCGIYDEVVPNVNAVHALEHGAVWITYDADAISPDDITTLRTLIPSTYMVVSPYADLPSPLVASAWGAQVALDGIDDERLASFLEKYWQSPTGPEPGAPCTGGIDGPGRVA